MDTKGRFLKTYDDEYYIVFELSDEFGLYLQGLERSENCNPGVEFIPPSGEPLYFENSYKEDGLADGVSRPILKAHMNVNDIILHNDIREKIKDFNMAGVQFYPATIIGDDGGYHDEYWYVNVYNRLDCLDFNRSEIVEYDLSETHHFFMRYSLSSNVLDAIPEEKRLIIKPGKTDMGFTFVHRKIAEIILGAGVGIWFLQEFLSMLLVRNLKCCLSSSLMVFEFKVVF